MPGLPLCDTSSKWRSANTDSTKEVGAPFTSTVRCAQRTGLAPVSCMAIDSHSLLTHFDLPSMRATAQCFYSNAQGDTGKRESTSRVKSHAPHHTANPHTGKVPKLGGGEGYRGEWCFCCVVGGGGWAC